MSGGVCIVSYWRRLADGKQERERGDKGEDQERAEDQAGKLDEGGAKGASLGVCHRLAVNVKPMLDEARGELMPDKANHFAGDAIATTRKC